MGTNAIDAIKALEALFDETEAVAQEIDEPGGHTGRWRSALPPLEMKGRRSTAC
jgi:hypothetical protein